jgi:hypothetical protein
MFLNLPFCVRLPVQIGRSASHGTTRQETTDARTDGISNGATKLAWRLLDPERHTGIAMLPERSIAALGQAAIWPTGALFHREPVPPRAERIPHVFRRKSRASLSPLHGRLAIIYQEKDRGRYGRIVAICRASGAA